MKSLNEYLRTTYRDDTDRLTEIHELLYETIPTFVTFWDDKEKTWPYSVSETHHLAKANKFSNSTHSMIFLSLHSFCKGCNGSILFPYVAAPVKLADKKIAKKLEKVVAKSKQELLEKIDGNNLDSTTFGENDPLSITWLQEISKAIAEPTFGSNVEKVYKKYKSRGRSMVWPGIDDREINAQSSFLKLRENLLARLFDEDKFPEEKLDFVTIVDQHLSYSKISDSRFDPATLVFAMEGALQLDKHAFSRATLNAIFDVLSVAQSPSAFWRPEIPLITTQTGMVLFPVGIEVTNSLLRSCEILDGQYSSENFIALENLFDRYFAWLMSRIVRGTSDNGENFVGWHSEHVNARGSIHLWETSQVILFLLHYAAVLKRKIAYQGIQFANLSLKKHTDIDTFEDYWDDEPLKALADDEYKILKKTKSDFIDNKQKGAVLLYGPPGTGKTTYAEQIAVRLGQPLITVTVSDFLAGGHVEVEARAKGIFKVLQAQQNVVILFDELDQFLLDRDSDAFKKQTGIFQFMTNGMLTKLQDLKDEENSVFVFATNYFERIDSAIRRRGRMDDYYLLALPDSKQRSIFLKRFLRDKKNLGKTSPVSTATNDAFETALRDKGVLRDTVFFGWGDLKHLVREAMRPEHKLEITTPIDNVCDVLLKTANKMTVPVNYWSYVGYKDAMVKSRIEDGAKLEYLILIYLLADADHKPNPKDKVKLERSLVEIDDEIDEVISDTTIVGKIKAWLEKHDVKKA